MTRAMLNPLSLESKMFADNLAPVKEAKERFEQLQKQAQDRLKKMGDMDDTSLRNTTPAKVREKKGESSPMAKSKTELLSPSVFNDSGVGNDFQILPQVTPAKNGRPDNLDAKKALKNRGVKSSNNSPLQVKFSDQIQKVNSSWKPRKTMRVSPNRGSQEHRMKVKLALLNDVLRKKEKLRQKVSEPLSTSQQMDTYAQTLRQYTQMAKYKQYDLDLDDYLLKDEFRKEALSIIGSQRAYRKIGNKILRSSERRLPGQSPVASMIKGQNLYLQEQQFKKNYSFLKHVESNKSEDGSRSPSRFPQLELSRLSKDIDTVPQSKQSPKKWRPSNNPNLNDQNDSQRGYLHESLSYKYEKRQSNLDTSRGINDTQNSSIAETSSYNINENLDRLRKIRLERKQVYDKERPQIYRIMDKDFQRNSYKKFNNM